MEDNKQDKKPDSIDVQQAEISNDSLVNSDKYQYVYKQFAKLVDKYSDYAALIHILQNLMIQYALAVHNGNKAMTADVLEKYMLPDLQKDIDKMRQEHLLSQADTTKAH